MGGGKYAPQGKLAVFAKFLDSRQQKTYQGTPGTQVLTPIGSKTSLGLSWTL